MEETFRDKIRSVNIGLASRRAPKVTTDHHDYGTVDVTEHWNDRVDVNVKPDTVRLKVSMDQGKG